MSNHIPTYDEVIKMDFSNLQNPEFVTNLEKSKGFYHDLKRIFDFVVAFIILITLAPILAIIGFLIMLDSPGSAYFAHERIGKNGKPFMLYKFRTMKLDANSQEFSPTNLNDPRITRIGRLLRRTSLDELPQLLNILRNEMSLVGPRPEMGFIVDTYTPIQKCRLLAQPGLTGLWQISGRKELPLHENCEFDLYYILHQNFWFDLKIIFKTITAVIKGKGAY